MAKVAYYVFDVESVPDGQLLASVKYRYKGITPEKAIALAQREAIDATGKDFISYAYQIPVTAAIAALGPDFEMLWLRSLPHPRPDSPPETERLRRLAVDFWDVIGCRTGTRPVLVTFNGRGFDLPIMELMAYKYGLDINEHYGKYGPRYRFGEDHVDLQEFMSNYGASRLTGGLNLLATLLGDAGKGDVAGDQINALYQARELNAISSYCRDDVLLTYAVFLRTRVMLGLVSRDAEAALLEKANRL